jgi:D-glycero-D-manno-heptose 1,7-bisphosphate phosphatase
MTRRAAFLDRDGTIIEDVSFIARPDQVQLRPGAAEAIGLLNENGVAVVVITNQSGIARGMFTVADYEAVRDRVAAVLAERGARIDASYYCPHHPSFSGPCDCRKPGRLLFDEAIADLGIDAAESMFAGDRVRDVLPARTYGGTGFLVRASSTPPAEVEEATLVGATVVETLLDAAHRFLATSERARLVGS